MWPQHIWSSATQTVKNSFDKLISSLREVYYKFYFFFWDLPFRWSDFLWLAALPVYMLVDTVRHELSHALMAWLLGVNVLAINIFPGRRLGYFAYGYVILNDSAPWLVVAAPYLCDLFVFVATYWLIKLGKPKRRWVFINLVFIGLLSPVYNSLSGYIHSSFINNDVARLMDLLPKSMVSFAFWAVMAIYALLLRKLYRLWKFTHKYQVPFWHFWEAGKKAFRQNHTTG